MCSMIAATTAALRDLLRSQILQIAPDMADLVVTAEAHGRARGGRSVPQFNVFLFYVPADRALRDRDLAAAREVAVPVFGATLSYLLTACGRKGDDADLTGHRVLGSAMAAREGKQLRKASAPESLRIVRLEMAAFDMATICGSFQTPCQLSVAYVIGPVLIESA